MKSKEQGKFILMVAAVMLAALLLAAPVFADGEAPLAEPLAQESAETTEAPTQEETPPEEELAPPEAAEELPAQEENTTPPASDEPSAEGTEAEPIPATEEIAADETGADETAAVVEALAEADLVLAGADGETLSLASAEGGQATIAPDPYFKVGTQYYRWLPIGGDCSPYTAIGDICTTSDTPIQAAIDYIQVNGTIPTDRKIYVETGIYSDTVEINGSLDNLGTLNGLIGVDGSANVILIGSLTIKNLSGGFTLQGFTVSGMIDFLDMAGNITLKDIYATGSNMGIRINNAASAVTFDEVYANNNVGRGALINNTASGKPYAVTIKNSTFNENNDGVSNVYGLDIKTLGKVTIENVSASRNRGAGIYLDTDFSALTVKNAVLMSNDADPNNTNYGFGLFAASSAKANITLDMVTASDSKENTNAVYLATAGAVTVNNTVAHGNTGWGLTINNTAGSGAVRVTNAKLINNGGKGLSINSLGPVYLSSIDASQNGSDGTFISTQNTVTITSDKKLGYLGANDFSSNGNYGLYVSTSKAIAITNIIADNNSNVNIYLDNTSGTAGVTIKKTLPSTQYDTFHNSASGSTGSDGLYIRSQGAVQVEYLIANDNALDGLFIDNASSTQSPGIKMLYSEAHNNHEYGINLESKGSLILTNTSANNNGLSQSRDGLRIYTLNGTSGGATITGINGYTCTFNENSRRGINIYALGNVSIKNAEAVLNQLGTYIENHTATSPKTVKVVNMNASGIKNGSGLEIFSKGTITLDSVSAIDNLYDGAILHNYYGTGSVSIKNSAFNHNQGNYGLQVYSNKNISINGMQAIDNINYGIYLDNCLLSGGVCSGNGTITINSGKNTYNDFSLNGDSGVYIFSRGHVSISNVIASNNGNFGVNINNSQDSLASGNVTISSAGNMRNTFSNNQSRGLLVASLGNISISNVDTFENRVGGAYLYNASGSAIKTVRVKDSTFFHNIGYGLDIESLGMVTLQGVDASDNSLYQGSVGLNGTGVIDVLSSEYEHDTYTFTVAAAGTPYTITLESLFFDAYLELRGPDGALIAFDDNSAGGTDALISGTLNTLGDYAIHVLSTDGLGSGAFSLDLNGVGYSQQTNYRGVNVYNANGTGGVKVLYSSKMGFGLRAWNNTYDGLRVTSTGAVSLDRVEVMFNGGSGIDISNGFAPENPVTLKNINAIGMYEHGVVMDSRGNISLNKVTSLSNRYTGASLTNSTSVVERWVKVSSSVLSNSFESDNLGIFSKGSITLTNIEASNSQGTGTNGATIYNTGGTGSVTVNGKLNVFDNNDYNGISIDSHGDISLTNIMASDNGHNGIYARNAYSGQPTKNITLTASGGKIMNTLHNNGNYNFFLNANGAVTVNKTEAVGGAAGSYIQNTNSPEPRKVAVSNSVFKQSTLTGLWIDAKGAVTLNNLWASDNGDYGIRVTNTSVTGEDVIANTITVKNSANHGLYIQSGGLIKIDKTTASGNNGYGIYAANTTGSEAIQVLNSTSALNTMSGIMMYSNGPLTIKNTNTISNLGHGIYFSGQNSGAAVTLSNVYTAMNQQYGIDLSSVQDVIISGSTAAVNGSSVSNGAGLRIQSNGSGMVTLSKSTFIGNYGNGVELFNVATFTQSNSVIFGNDVDGSGDPDYVGP